MTKHDKTVSIDPITKDKTITGLLENWGQEGLIANKKTRINYKPLLRQTKFILTKLLHLKLFKDGS